jgi:hypothetical protein
MLVKTMRDFMTYDHTKGTIIQRSEMKKSAAACDSNPS